MTFSTARNIKVSLNILFADRMDEADEYSVYREMLQTKVMELGVHYLYEAYA
jgi:hypothetical protein